jgi:pimeloyl-ACP methyl ester carboxylesterase
VAGLAGAALVAGLLAGQATSAATPAAGAATHLPSTAGPAATSAPPVPWRDCGDGFQCATVKVPLDYDRPDGRLIDLALARLPASDPAHRLGSLFANFGGPGASGVLTVRSGARLLYPPGVRARFDIVGFDPRGVGSSTAVRCFASTAEQHAFLPRYPIIPTSRQERRELGAKVRELVRHCEARVGWLLPHLSTADVARDLDVLRARVGDDKLTYVGYSYGTYLGATYANLFPQRVRALALDAVIDASTYATGPSTSFLRQHSDRGSATTLREFFRLCAQAGSRCAFAASGRPARKFATLAGRLRSKPVPTPDGSTFGYSDLVVNTISGLYLPWRWADLATFLQQLYEATTPGEASAAAARLRGLAGQPLAARGSAADDSYDNYGEAGFASACSETRNPRTMRGYRRAARAAEARSRYVGAYWSYVNAGCLAWPRAQDRYTGPWSTPTSAPILLVNNRFDPATPHRSAVAMNRLLPRSRLLTVDGWGHTALQTRSACADGAVERYLVRLALPRPGATCETGVVPFVEVPGAQRRLLPDGGLPGWGF